MISINAQSYCAENRFVDSLFHGREYHRTCPTCGSGLPDDFGMSLGNVEIDEDGDVRFRGEVMAMTRRERDLACALIRARGRWLTRGMLVEALGIDINDSTISKYIQRLRIKFRAHDPAFDQIICGKGFRTYRR